MLASVAGGAVPALRLRPLCAFISSITAAAVTVLLCGLIVYIYIAISLILKVLYNLILGL
jgi:hypothetical protein